MTPGSLLAPLVEMQVGKIEAHSAKDPLNPGLQSTMWLREAACQAFQLSNRLCCKKHFDHNLKWE